MPSFLKSISFLVPSAILLLAGTIFVWATYPYGLGVANDSVMYLEGARSLASTGTYADADGIPIVLWPPLYSVILALAGIFHVDVFRMALVLNLGFYLGFTACWYVIFMKLTKSVVLSSIAMMMIAFSYEILLISQQMLTDIGFFFMESLIFVFLLYYLDSKKLKYLALLVAFSALLPLERYAGAVVVAGIGIGLLLFDDDAPLARWFRTLGYGLLTAIPLTIWLGRNLSVSGSFTGGDKTFSYDQVPETILLSFYTIGRWFLPFRFSDESATIFGVAIIVATLVGMTYLIRNADKNSRNFIKIIYLSSFLLILFTIVALTTVQGAQRYLLPLYPIVLLSILGSLGLLIRKIEMPGFWASTAMLLFGACLAAVPVLRGKDRALLMHDFGDGMTAKEWRESEMITFAQGLGLSAEDVIYCDNPILVRFVLGVRCDGMTPDREHKFQNFRRTDGMAQFHQTLDSKTGPIYILFFDWGRDSLFRPEELRDRLQFHSLKQFSKGEILIRNGA